jgi:uroporphyrinogen decarboxylase
MDFKERFLRVMDHEETDRIATHDNISSGSLLRKYGGDLVDTDLMLAGKKTCLDLGIDALRFLMNTEGVAEEGEVVHGDGWIHKRYYYTTWIVERKIQTIEDFDESPIERRDEDAIARDAEAAAEHYRETQAKIDPIYYLYHNGNWVPGIGSYAQGHLGLMLFSKVIYSEGARARRDIKNIAEDHVTYAKICAENDIAPVIFGGEDITTNHGPFVHPKLLRELFFPYLTRIVKAFRKHGIKYVFHSDGDLWPVLDDLVAAGVAGIHPFEPFCGMDLLKVKEKIGDKVVLFGNIDCSGTLPLGSVEDVTKEVVSRIHEAGPGSGYVLGSSSEIEEIVPIPNIETMFQTLGKYGKFPR